MIVTWKDEGRTGPVRIYPDEAAMRPQRWNPNRPPPAWTTRAEARRIAHDLGAEFREV